MTVPQQFRLPDVGEGLTEADIATWRVALGDTVAVNDVLVEIETAKAMVELPSPYAGTVLELLAAEGDTVPVGTPIITIGELGTVRLAAPSHAGAHSAGTTDPAAEPAPSVLVGYGPIEHTGRRRRRRRRPAAAVAPHGASSTAAPSNGTTAPRTKPPVRKLARDLRLDLTAVTPTGEGGLILRADVVRHAGAQSARTAAPAAAAPAEPVSEPTRPGADAASTAAVDAPADETRIPVKGVRKATAAAISASAFTAPHVTAFVTADVTRSVKLVDRLRAHPDFDGARVTILLLVARALLAAVREYPEINASWDGETGEIVLHQRVNLGIAAATPRGLLVPNIKDAGALGLPGLARAIGELVRTARDGKASPADMARGTITITNIGVFGVDTGTPILNRGEAAILCIGAARRLPWEHRGKVRLRWTMQLSLSFDHRLVDGELGSRVLARVARILENPKLELLLT